MPKLKTKKAISKRMKLTKTGKVKRYKSGRRHLMACKSGNRRRKMRRPLMINDNQLKMVVQLLSPGR